MSTKEESFKRLRAEAWLKSRPNLPAAGDASAKYQALANGSGTYVFDEYSVIISKMPDGLTAEQFLLNFAKDPNGTLGKAAFDAINVFTKRTPGEPKIGDIYDIDILGPKNGSIILVDISEGFGRSTGDAWFAIQTISTDKYGDHPENGAREFGFEYVPQGVKFYTRGVSRPGNIVLRLGGSVPQTTGWTALMKGINDAIKALDGTPLERSFSREKTERAN